MNEFIIHTGPFKGQKFKTKCTFLDMRSLKLGDKIFMYGGKLECCARILLGRRIEQLRPGLPIRYDENVTHFTYSISPTKNYFK